MCEAVAIFTRLSMQHHLWYWYNRQESEFFNIAVRRDAYPAEFAADLAALTALVATGALDPVIGKVWQFEEAKTALEGIASGAHTGKQIIHVSSP